MCEALGFHRDEILFNQRTLHAVEASASGSLAESIERMFQLLRQLSYGGRNELTVLVEDGPTALGVLAHAVMQVVAHPCDRFFVQVDTAPSREPSAQSAALHYAEVPLLLRDVGAQPVAHYMDAVAVRRTERQRLETPDPLRLDLRRRSLVVGGTEIRLPATQFFWMYYLAASAGERFPLLEISTALSSPKRPMAPLTQKLSDGRARVFPDDLKRAYVRVFPQAADKFDAMFQRSCGPHPGLPSTISKINAALRRALGRGARPYLIQGGRGAGGYRVTLCRSSIHSVE